MKILITGSSGFVGKHLVRVLSKDNEIVKFDLKNGQNIFDEKLLSRKLKKVDVVIHLAAYISAMESWQKPEEYFKNNAIGTYRVIKSSIENNVKRMIFFSSAAVKARPLTPYAISKIAAEKICLTYMNDINVTIIRPENIYGPGQKESYGYVIHNFINQASGDAPIKIYGDGLQTRDFIYVDDVVRVIGQLLQKSINTGTIISLGTGKSTKILDLAKLVKKVTRSKSKIEYKEKRMEPENSVANINSLRRLGISTHTFVSLGEGVARLFKKME